MKLNELRIGNWVNDFKCEYQITPGDFYNMYLDGDCPFSPIPITEEWLLKFGFKDGYIELNEQQIYINVDYDIFNLFGSDSVTSGQTFSGNIKYVHQLQNLIFALTGEELAFR